MSVIRLYVDEDSQDQALLKALRARNVDVMTVKKTQTEGLIDLATTLAISASFMPNSLQMGKLTQGSPYSLKFTQWVNKLEPYWSLWRLEPLKRWKINLSFSAST